MKEGRYEYLEKIGEGGMATVYRGIQKSLDRPVAIKVLSKQLSTHPSVRKRFQRESLIVARLNHPNIIHVIDKGTTSKGRPVFVMEYVEGKNLADLINENTLTFNRKIDLMVQICKGLAYAHKAGIIHRDIKPANVIIDDEGNARLLDFGIATFFEDEKGRSSETNLILGTEGYMAPEQKISAHHTTEQSDIYSLGVMMYKLFTGRMPAVGCQPPANYEPKLAGTLNDLVLECLAENPSDRPASVEDVKNRLLLTHRGKHLGSAQMARADEGLSDIKQKFSLLDVIKETKHGSVFLFEDRRGHSLLVIKKKNNSFAGYKEAKILSQLKHKNIINIYGASKKESVFIIVMEYVSGGALQDRMLDRFSVEEFGLLARQMSEGLAFAHRNRVIHGNLRPSNILLTSNLQVKLTDFALDEHYVDGEARHNWYRLKGEEVSEMSDIFSLGAIFHHMLIGVPPEYKDGRLIRGKTFLDLPQILQQLITRMLEPMADRRPQSMDAVLSEIIGFTGDAPARVALNDDDERTQIRDRSHQPAAKEKASSVTWLHLLLGFLIVASFAFNILFVMGGDELVKATLASWLDKLGIFH
jgi:serine/threonine-protein kinase